MDHLDIQDAYLKAARAITLEAVLESAIKINDLGRANVAALCALGQAREERDALQAAIEAALSAQRDAEALEMSHSEVIEQLQAAISTMAKAKPLLYRCAPAAEFSAFCGALDSARGLLKA